MRVRLRLLAFALALLVGQQLIAALVPDWAQPDLVLVFALAMGLRVRRTEGLLFAFALGYAVDALSGAPTGLNALLYGTACAATRLADRALYLRAPLPWAAWALGYSLLNVVLLGTVIALFTSIGVPWGDLLVRLPGAALGTAVCAGFSLRVFLQLDAVPERESGFASLLPRGTRP